MNFRSTLTLILAVISSITGTTQIKTIQNDSVMIRKIYNEALENGQAYEHLRFLCKNIGNRLSGSIGEEMAVQWGLQTLSQYSFDKVYLQEVMVPHWERGTKEKGYFQDENGTIHQVNLLALGGSISTDGVLSGEIVMFKSREELQNADKKEVEGKIVFLAEKMNQKNINTFKSYGESGSIRWKSAIEASKKGAKAIVISSLSLSENQNPNTGSMGYEEGIKKIPAAALSTEDATRLEKILNDKNKKVTFYFEMDCKTFPDKKSYNVIAEINGKKYPNNFITVGGHLDSWDVGEGAHDDGAGIVQSMEAIRILKTLNYQPQNTIRVVFFMNEENGNRGGEIYATKAKENNENHIYAIESDAGGFTPRGFRIQSHPTSLELVKSFENLFNPYLLHTFENGYAGVCINPLKNKYDNITLVGLSPDSQRYFDIHHNANDVFENINKRELHLGAAAISSLVYLLDKRYEGK